MLKDWQDAYRQEVYDTLQGKGEYESVERDDGYIDFSGGSKIYFSEYNDWPKHEKEAMKFVQGKVLDIGCGAGRHSLNLQEKGYDVVDIDTSPLAIEVCKKRGIRNARILAITKITPLFEKSDTILMLGNNFGLFGSFKRAQRLPISA